MNTVENNVVNVTDSIAESFNRNTILKTIILVVLCILVLYLIYKLLVGLNDKVLSEPYLIKGYHNALSPVIYSKELPPSLSGYGFTYSFWIYVVDWGYNFKKPKHIFHVGDAEGNEVCPGLYLYPENNNLMVRVDNHNRYNNVSTTTSGKKCQNWKSQYPHLNKKYTEKNYPGADLGNHNFCRNPDKRSSGAWCYTEDPETETEGCGFDDHTVPPSMNPLLNPSMLNEDKECDIVNLPIQRWVHINVVLDNKTLDVYLNGKIRRSCTLENVPKFNNGQVYITQFGGFKGFISDLQYLNRALDAREIYRTYLSYPKRLNVMHLLNKLVPKVDLKFQVDVDVSDNSNSDS